MKQRNRAPFNRGLLLVMFFVVRSTVPWVTIFRHSNLNSHFDSCLCMKFFKFKSLFFWRVDLMRNTLETLLGLHIVSSRPSAGISYCLFYFAGDVALCDECKLPVRTVIQYSNAIKILKIKTLVWWDPAIVSWILSIWTEFIGPGWKDELISFEPSIRKQIVNYPS